MQVGLEKRPCAVFDGAAKPPIRLVLVEDHAILREGLKALIELEAGFRVVGEFPSPEREPRRHSRFASLTSSSRTSPSRALGVGLLARDPGGCRRDAKIGADSA